MDILEIEILTDNVEATEKFYNHILELKIIRKDPYTISFLAGKTVLSFLQSNKINPLYHFAFNIPNNKFEEAISWISSKLDIIKIKDNEIVADFKSWNAKAFYCYDNNRNIIEFIARYELDNESDKPFGGASIQSVSEIGIVTEDVPKLTDDLIEREKLFLFSKQARQDDFSVIGDDKGLFIIVKEDRKWYPTEQKAGKYYSRIKISVEGLLKEIILNE